jgi:hypothetical protein
MALDPSIVARANQRLWTKYPDLRRRQLTNHPEDAALRREWFALYAEEQSAANPPPAPAVQPSEPSNLPDAGAELVAECCKECTDQTGRTCLCKEQVTITLYVEKGDSPPEIVADYAWDKLTLKTPQPSTGHAFLGIGGETQAEQKVFGFYPTTSWFGAPGAINTNEGFYRPGQALPDDQVGDPENIHFYSHKQSYKACPQTATMLQASIDADIERIKLNSADAPRYDLHDLQCTTWARRKLREVGFPDLGGHSPYGAAQAIDEANATQEAGPKKGEGLK